MNKYIFITVKLYPKKAKIEKYKDDYEDSDSDEPIKNNDESDASSSVNGNLFSSDDENTENEDDYDNEYQNNVAAAAYNPNAAPWRPAFN